MMQEKWGLRFLGRRKVFFRLGGGSVYEPIIFSREKVLLGSC